MSNKVSGIYMILNLKTSKMYIGQSKDVKNRWRKHKYELKANIHFNSYLQNAYNKHGIECFEFKVIEECQDDMIDEKECYYIDFYKTMNRNYGYNLNSGGNFNKKHSKETKEKIKKSNLNKKRSEYTKERNRQANLGKKLTDEHKSKISKNNAKTNLGKKLSNDTKKKISESRMRYPLTQEMIDDIRNGMTIGKFKLKYGSYSPCKKYRSENLDKNLPMNYGASMRGKKQSDESKQKISNAKIIYNITDDMIVDIKNGISRNKFYVKYGTEQPWRRYRRQMIKLQEGNL